MKPTFEELIDRARAYEVDTTASEFAFETRLLAAVRDLKKSENGFLETFGNWLWRSAFGMAPVIAILMAIAIFLNGVSIPDGAASIVSQVVDSLPSFSDPTLLDR